MAVTQITRIPASFIFLYYAHKTADATSDKARLEIIKTLSYKLSIEYTLTYDDIVSVYKSKLREHKIRKAKFGIVEIIHDLKSDIMSNAFIDNSIRSEMLLNLSRISTPEQERERERTVFRNSIIVRLMYALPRLLTPTFIYLIIMNVLLFLRSLSGFVVLVYDTIFWFNEPFLIDEPYDMPFYYVVDEWGRFFCRSGLYISIPCLVAWTILIVAYRHINSNDRRL